MLTKGFDSTWFPQPTFLLYVLLPGPIGYGQPTPAGNVLPVRNIDDKILACANRNYCVNGWNAWWLSHIVLFVAVFVLKLFPASIIADEWLSLWVTLNIFGYFWTLFAYAKANISPSHPDDCKFSGSILYDMFMGIEHNPRFGNWFDFKLFFNGRPGILGWSVIQFSFAAAQYNRWGNVSNSMICVIILHLLYILDFFYHEDWYLRTIDIAHDHFGYYLAWGDTIWLPMLYTLQSCYLLYQPIDNVTLSNSYLILTLSVGALGYYVFRGVNNQKDLVRLSNGNVNIWGKPAQFITCKYLTASGPKTSLLLTSGYWGLSRHFNYVGDLLISLAMCMACGTNHVIPYFYVVYMTVVLVHRVGRDHARCSAKYGKYWEEYCQRVPWKILPYIY